MKKPLISVIIPTYNRSKCLRTAIDSVVGQRYKDYEIIVVDDGSTDDTLNILMDYSSKIKVLKQQNAGVSKARNCGIEVAKGKWVAFLDSDDTWNCEKLWVQIRDLIACPQAIAHMVDSKIFLPDSSTVTLFELRGMEKEYRKNKYRKNPLCDVIATQFFTSSWMIRKDIIKKVGCFNPEMKIFEDFDLLTKVALEGSFIISSYIGTNMHRQPQDVISLSEIYNSDPIQAINNSIKIYNHLKSKPCLNKKEMRLIYRELSGALCELASEYYRCKELKKCIVTAFMSIKCDLGLRSIIRSIIRILIPDKIVYIFVRLTRRKQSIRRSEFYK